jgi:hypothetical protein
MGARAEMKPGVLPAIGGSGMEGAGGGGGGGGFGGGMGGGGSFPMLGPNGQPFNFKTKVCDAERRKSCDRERFGVSGGRSLTRPFRHARRFPSPEL